MVAQGDNLPPSDAHSFFDVVNEILEGYFFRMVVEVLRVQILFGLKNEFCRLLSEIVPAFFVFGLVSHRAAP